MDFVLFQLQGVGQGPSPFDLLCGANFQFCRVEYFVILNRCLFP